MSRPADIYGLLAEFEHAEDLITAARKTREAGYHKFEAYTPFPVHGLDKAVGFRRTRLPLIVLTGGLIGAIGGFIMQYYASVISYPINVGGRPLNSWPSFIIVCFELTILCSALSAVLGMLFLNGLPMPYHPVFNVPGFQLASRDKFFLCIESADPRFDAQETRRFLHSLSPREVSDVEP